MSFKLGSRVTISDRGLKTNSMNGTIVGIEPNTDKPVYNVNLELHDKNGKLTGTTRIANFLEDQITKEVEIVPVPKLRKNDRKPRKTK